MLMAFIYSITLCTQHNGKATLFRDRQISPCILIVGWSVLMSIWRLRFVFISTQWLIRISLWFNDDVIEWKHFPRGWPFVRGIHRSPVNSPHKGMWRRALMFTLICARINGWVNTREAGDLRRYCPHYDVIVMSQSHAWSTPGRGSTL